jgi:cellulose 1,4-beta-cellobiosidase
LSRIDGTSALWVWGSSFGATSYNIKRSPTSGGPFTTIATGVTGIYTDGSVSPAATYYYTVSAVNSIGESANAPQASVLTSSAPTLTATNGVNLSFPAPPGALAGGWIERSTSSSGPFSWLASPNTNSYSDPAICGTTYYYRVHVYGRERRGRPLGHPRV